METSHNNTPDLKIKMTNITLYADQQNLRYISIIFEKLDNSDL